MINAPLVDVRLEMPNREVRRVPAEHRLAKRGAESLSASLVKEALLVKTGTSGRSMSRAVEQNGTEQMESQITIGTPTPWLPGGGILYERLR